MTQKHKKMQIAIYPSNLVNLLSALLGARRRAEALDPHWRGDGEMPPPWGDGDESQCVWLGARQSKEIIDRGGTPAVGMRL
jgi:hypothetical protein